MQNNLFTLLALSGRDAERETLSALAGGGDTLEFTMTYAPPYEDFRGIRDLQLALRSMGAFPPETLVIDLTEWIGHEQEEFLEIASMYLHDHRDLWNYVFIAREKTASDCGRLYFTLRVFLEGRMEEDLTFADKDSLAAYLLRRKPITLNAADRLAGILLKPEARMFRSYPRVLTLLDELSAGGKITENRLSEVTEDPTSALHLIAGRNAVLRPVRPERSVYGKEN